MKDKQLLIILVLYKTRLDESLTYLSFKKNIEKINFGYDFLVYNNFSEIIIESSEEYTVVNVKNSGMLAEAYNYALQKANKEKKEWLLLLDQDTDITSAYIEELSAFLANPECADITAAMPTLKYENIILSPKRIDNKRWKHYDLEKKKYYRGEKIIAYNSLTLIKTKFMYELGGFSNDFPLDMLDYWYYNKIYEHNGKIYVFDSEITHDLSLLNYENNISIERHANLLTAEKTFVRDYLGKKYRFSYNFSLLKRFIKEMLFFKDKTYAKITWSKLISQ